MAYVVVVSSAINLTSTALQIASKETTDCGKKCRAKCQAETGTFFSGREKCKKQCKADCVNQLSPQQQQAALREQEKQDAKTKTTATIIVISVIIIIILLLILIFRKK